MFEMIAYGDSLGFPVESGVLERVDGLTSWIDKDGFEIEAGEYSDDTQLTLSTARSIRGGRFDPEYFAYVELPLWAYYQKGGGKANLSASTNMFTIYVRWNNNFYPKYEDMGGNGAAMRISPIVMATLNSCYRDMVIDVFKNTLITHGHPCAFVGSISFALVLRFLMFEKDREIEYISHLLRRILSKVIGIVQEESDIREWFSMYRGDFKSGFERCSEKFLSWFEKMIEFEDYGKFCEAVGEKENPGFALSSVLCAFHSFFKNSDPKTALIETANEKGTDTDTISSMAGALFSAVGMKIEDEELSKVQDIDYLLNIENSVLEGGKERKFDRKEVRKWAEEFQKLSREGKIPDWHPVFGRLSVVDEKVSRKKVRLKVKTEEGQTIHFKIKKIT